MMTAGFDANSYFPANAPGGKPALRLLLPLHPRPRLLVLLHLNGDGPPSLISRGAASPKEKAERCHYFPTQGGLAGWKYTTQITRTSLSTPNGNRETEGAIARLPSPLIC
jgi:hypothetical protein